GGTRGREHNEGPAIQFAGDRVGGVVGDQQRPGAVDVRAGFATEIAELAFGFERAEERRNAAGDGRGRGVVEGGTLGATVAVIIAGAAVVGGQLDDGAVGSLQEDVEVGVGGVIDVH